MANSNHGDGSHLNPSQKSNPIIDEVDWHVDREERNTLFKLLKGNPGSRPAEWRLRVKRQRNIVSELTKHGQLAVLSAGPLLVTWTGVINNLERNSSWRVTLDESPMMRELNLIQRAQIFGAKSDNWTRTEKAIQSLGHCLCLAVKDLNDQLLLAAFNQLKVELVRKAFASDEATDNVIKYVKWLGKSCQKVFLRTPCTNEGKINPIVDKNGTLLPFVGTLKYISDEILSGSRRKSSLSYERARQLSQLGNVPRGLPYPSFDQSKESVQETVDVIQTTFKPTQYVLDKYRSGLDTIVRDNGSELLPKSHVSLATSGKFDSSRSQGGGSAYLVKMTRSYTDRVLTEEVLKSLTGKFDQFGDYLVSPTTAILAAQFLGYEEFNKPKAYTTTPTIGDVLYVRPESIEIQWENTLKNSGKRVPPNLAKLLNLTASMMMLEAGQFDQPMEFHHGVMTFKTRINVFKLRKDFTFPVKADVSIESGLKTRLTTGGMTAFAHLSQLPSNYMRDYLSKDPFFRTGFQEPDKLWSVLKVYKTRFHRNSAE